LENDVSRETPAGRAAPLVPDYELLRLIGRGAYGEVWLARNALGGHCAVKVVRREDFEEARPFDREFEGIRRYEPVSRANDGLTQVLHAGWGEGGAYFYYVMELADAMEDAPGPHGKGDEFGAYVPRTLRGEIRRRGVLPVEECTAIGLALAQALARLHAAALVHRDLKPSNVIFVHGRAKLADIGLVGLAGDVRSVVGTEGFVPREGTGQPAADVFGLGKVLYEAATGRDRHDFPAIPAAWAKNPAALEFNEVLLRACDGEAARRYASAEEMAADLAQLQAGRSLRRARAIQRQLRWAKRMAAMLIVAALIALGGWVAARWQQGRERTLRLRAESAEETALLAQAGALVRSGHAGQRFEALEAVRRVAMRTPSLEARRLAAAALCLPDIRVASRQAYPHSETDYVCNFDPAIEHFARWRAGEGVSIHECADGREIARLPGAVPQGDDMHVEFAASGRVVTHGGDGIVRVWDWQKGKKLWELPATSGARRALPEASGKQLLVLLNRQVLAVHDLSTGVLLRELPLPHLLSTARLDARGKYAAWIQGDKLEVMRLASGVVEREVILPGPAADFALSPDGDCVAVGFHDGALGVWETDTGALRFLERSHADLIHRMAFHPSGQWLVTSSWDGTVRLWNSASGKAHATFTGAGAFLRFSPDGARLAVATFSGEVLRCEVALPWILREFPMPASPPRQWPFAAALSEDRRLLAVGSTDGPAFYDWRTGRRLAARSGGIFPGTQFVGPTLLLSGEQGCARWPMHAEGNVLTLGPPHPMGTPGDPGGLAVEAAGAVWRIENNTVRRMAPDQTDRRYRMPAAILPAYLAVSADGRWLAASAWRVPACWIWAADGDGMAREVPLDRNGARVTFTPDSRALIVATGREYLFLDPSTGGIQRRIARYGPSSALGYTSFSQDGRWLLLTDDHAPLRVLDASTFEELLALDPPSHTATFAFSHDGRWIFSGTTALDLWGLRRELRAMGLDWPQHPPPAEPWPEAGPEIERLEFREK
jgi:WD40 repeat protein